MYIAARVLRTGNEIAHSAAILPIRPMGVSAIFCAACAPRQPLRQLGLVLLEVRVEAVPARARLSSGARAALGAVRHPERRQALLELRQGPAELGLAVLEAPRRQPTPADWQCVGTAIL